MSSIRFVALTLVGIAVCVPALGTSVRNVHSELVGIDEVSINISLTTLPGMNREVFATRVRDLVEAAGLRVNEEANVSLFLHSQQQVVPGCDELLVVRTVLELSEDAKVPRAGKDIVVWAKTYSNFDSSVIPKSKAGETAEDSILRMLAELLDAQRYAASLKGNGK